MKVCAPILKEYGVNALFFVNSGLLDVSHDASRSAEYVVDNLKLSSKVLLTWDGARLLRDAGHSIGGHTVHHQSLPMLQISDIESEVQNDKEKIEKELGVSVVDFAYPFGVSRDYSKEVETLVRASGYTHVYIAEPGFVSDASQHIPRTLFEKQQSLDSVYAWIQGSYDVFVAMKQFLKKISHI